MHYAHMYRCLIIEIKMINKWIYIFSVSMMNRFYLTFKIQFLTKKKNIFSNESQNYKKFGRAANLGRGSDIFSIIINMHSPSCLLDVSYNTISCQTRKFNFKANSELELCVYIHFYSNAQNLDQTDTKNTQHFDEN